MAGTIVVARVAVRVYPDTKEFRKELQADLKKIQDVEVEVPVRPKLENAEVKKVEAELEAALKPVEVTVEAKLEPGTVEAVQAEVQTELTPEAVAVEPKLDEVRARETISKLKAILDAIKARVQVVTELAAGTLEKVKAQINLDLAPNHEVQVALALKNADVIAAKAKLDEALSHVRTASVAVEVNEASLGLAQARLAVLEKKRLTASVEANVDLASVSVAEARLAALEKKRLTAKVFTDVDEASLEMARAKLALMEKKVFAAKVEADVDDASIFKAKADIAAILAKSVDLKIKAQADRASADKARLEYDAVFARAIKQIVKPELSPEALVKAKAEMDAMFAKNQNVKIKPVLDKLGAAQVEAWFMRLSGAQMITGQITKGIEAFKELPGMVPGLIVMVPLIGSVTAAILNMGGALLSLGRDVAKAVPILLAVPAVFLGLGLTLTALFVAFKKLKTVMPEVYKQFEAIKSSLRDSFWKTAFKPMENAFATMLPRINKGMVEVGSSTGLWFSDLMSKFSNTLPFETFFGAVAKMNVGLLPFNTALTSIFDTIFKMSDWLLPSFAGGLSDLTTKFALWFKTANDTGQLQVWIVTATQKFKDFWKLIVAVYNWLAALTRPLEELNKMTMSGLADSFQRGADAMNTSIGQINIKKVFESAQIAMNNFWANSKTGVSEFFNAMPDFMMKALPTLGAAGGTLAGAILGGLKGALPGILEFFDAIAYAVNFLAPQIKEAVSQIGSTLGKDLGAMVRGFTPLLNDVLIMFNSVLGLLSDTILHLSHGLTALLDPIMPYVNEVILAVGKGINKIAVILDDLMVFLAPHLAKLMQDLVPLIQKAIDGIIPVIKSMSDIIKELVPIIGPILTFILDVLVSTVLPALDLWMKETLNVIKTIESMATTIMLAFSQLSNGDIIGAFKTLTDGIGAAWTTFIETTKANTEAAGQKIVDNLSGKNATVDGPTVIDVMLQNLDASLANWLLSIGAQINAFGQAVDTGISAAMGPLPATVLSYLIVAGIDIGSWFTTTLDGFGMFAVLLNGLWDNLWAGICSTVDAFGNVLQAANNATLSAMLSVFSGFGGALQGQNNSLWGAVGGAIQWFLNGIQNSFSSGWDTVLSIANAAWNSLSSGIQWGIENAIGLLASIPGRAMDVLGNIGNALYNAGSALMQGFFGGLVSWFNTIFNVLDDFTRSLPFHKGPIELDRVLFKPAGIAIMQSLLNGFELGAKSIWDYLDTFTKDLAGTEFAATLSANAMNAVGNAATSATGANASPSVQVTNYYPQAEPTSRTVNRALQLATLF